MANRKEIRNSTVEFLIFQIEGKEQGVEVYYKDKTVWCTQKAMGMLFDCSTDNIGLHLKNIFASGELEKDSVTEKISATASDGKKYMTQFYNLDAVISVGYRVNSIRATQFRQWATSVLQEFAIRGYVLDKKRMAKRHIPMTMEDWAKQIDTILAAGGNEVLQTTGQVSADQAKEHAETEFEKYRIIQDRLFQSDFDRFMDALFEGDSKG
ncbi:MAG: virulence RhuM family protein [Bacteroidaceae bacterium]|nr:virulence RhuM family protein [Bacteroidaceae bacterium]